jgi:hypothetical protein
MLTKYEMTLREWKKFMTEEEERIRNVLSSGAAVKNYEDYVRLVGRMEGLRSAHDFMTESEKEVERNY